MSEDTPKGIIIMLAILFGLCWVLSGNDGGGSDPCHINAARYCD